MSGKFLELLFITLGSHSVAELAKIGLKDCTTVLINYFQPAYKAMSKNTDRISSYVTRRFT